MTDLQRSSDLNSSLNRASLVAEPEIQEIPMRLARDEFTAKGTTTIDLGDLGRFGWAYRTN